MSSQQGGGQFTLEKKRSKQIFGSIGALVVPPPAPLSTVFASPVFDSIDILEINSFSSRHGMCPQKIPIRRRQVVFTHSLLPTMNGGITKPVIMDVVQYEGVNSPDCTS